MWNCYLSNKLLNRLKKPVTFLPTYFKSGQKYKKLLFSPRSAGKEVLAEEGLFRLNRYG
jgi:hypothetical protein